MNRSRRPAALGALVATALLVAACGAGSTTSAPSSSAAPSAAPPSAAARSAAPSPSSASAGASASAAPATPSPATETPMPAAFTLTSTAFAAGDSIPRRFTCDGEDASPDLAWSGAPDGTTALVLLVDDPDAGNFVHWIVLDMTGTDSGALPAGVSSSPDAPPQGTNDFGRVGWGGPCPPSGTHRYAFTLYALAAPLALGGAPRGGAVRRALAGAQVLGSAKLEARYRRGG